MRWRSNGAWASPAVIRVPIGGYLTGGAIYHSQSGESIFTHIPGLRVVFPSNALDANGLLRTAIRCDDPVLFLEHKRLYRETYGRARLSGPGVRHSLWQGQDRSSRRRHHAGYLWRAGAARLAGRATGPAGTRHRCGDSRPAHAQSLRLGGDCRASVRKTNRVIVAHEDMLSWGYGAEIAARIADELFDDLDAPVRRIGSMDTFVAYQPKLEDAILPQPETILKAIVDLKKY